MVLKSDQQRVRLLLKEAIPMLLKNGLNFRAEFDLEVFVGITLDKDEMIHFSISETIKNDDFSDDEDDGDDTVEAITSGEKELTALDQGEDSCLETFSSFPSPKRLRLEPGTETDHTAQSQHDSLDHRLSGDEHANNNDRDSPSPSHSGTKRKLLETSADVDVKEELDVVVIKEEPPDHSGVAYQSNMNRSRHQTFMPPTLSFGDDSSLFGDASSAMFSNTGDISFDKSLMDPSLQQQQQSHVGIVPVGSYIANMASSQSATCASASQASTSRSHQERLQQGQQQAMVRSDAQDAPLGCSGSEPVFSTQSGAYYDPIPALPSQKKRKFHICPMCVNETKVYKEKRNLMDHIKSIHMPGTV